MSPSSALNPKPSSGRKQWKHTFDMRPTKHIKAPKAPAKQGTKKRKQFSPISQTSCGSTAANLVTRCKLGMRVMVARLGSPSAKSLEPSDCSGSGMEWVPFGVMEGLADCRPVRRIQAEPIPIPTGSKQDNLFRGLLKFGNP